MLVALWIAGSLVALVVLLAAVGACLPRGHVASSAIRVPASPDAVWAVVTDFATWPAWAPDVTGFERSPDVGGRPVWTMLSRHGRLPLAVEESVPPRRLVTRIADDSLPFGGRWIWEIAGADEVDGGDGGDGGARVTLTEDGFVGNVVFRALSKFVFGHHRTQEGILRGLAARLGAAGAPIERVR